MLKFVEVYGGTEMMKKESINKIRMDIISNEESVLSLLLDKSGTLYRQGHGALPVEEFAVTSESDGTVFKQVLDTLDERAFEHAGVYDHPDKSGVPVQVVLALLDDEDNTVYFEFKYGTETADVGDLLPYVDKVISNAIELTNYWYYLEKDKGNTASTDAESSSL